MDLNTIKQVQSKQSYPSVTITLPTYRTSPDNDKDVIRLKNLVGEAVGRLENEFGKRETADIVEAVNRLADSVDNEQNLDGLVIFASAEYAEMFRLPFRVPERVTIADNFLTRDLVFALNRSPLYLLTVLSEHGTRLFVGQKENLDEIEAYGFPFSIENAAADAGPSQDISHVRDQMVTDKMREVGQALAEAQAQIPAPLAVLGVDRNIGHFKDGAAAVADKVMLYIHGGHNSDNAHELGQTVWPQVKEALAAERLKVFDELGNAKGNQLFAGGLNEVWQAAVDGRTELLVVEEDLHIAAEVSGDGRKLTETADAQGECAYDDIVDEIIEKVLAAGGRVKFVDNGSLAEHAERGLAAVTRY
ncbi:hypothetical protein V6667_09110 [Neisseria leonii]|uniref:Uncharacterized protein n=1 Tax=Neisseria leonii TaxID=2995413 RepID=A0A9X4IDN5_9NEIS|nr:MULTISPECIES: hypothetical protein [unclassified Neisseria]MDD9325740.1 hypothetical protein [Neisseria sp. 3986]MDD9327881.1 hypothetical protein [Neisseria sp. 51.81]